MLSENSFQTVLILLEKKVEFNILKWLRLQKQIIWISAVPNFYCGWCWLLITSLSFFLKWRGKIKYSWDIPGFAEPVWTKKFRIQEQLKISMKKWSFSSTFQVPKNSRTTQRIQEIQEVVPTIRYGIRHFCLQNLREMGSKTSYLP